MSYIYENERDYDYCDNRPACRTYNRAPEPGKSDRSHVVL